MAAAVFGSTKKFAADNVSTLESDSFTVGGANRVLYAFVSSGAGSPVAPTSVKWGGSGGTALTQLSTTLTVSSFGRLSLWRLIAPAATSSTIYADWGGNQDERFIIGVAVEDADQSTPNGTVATATGTNLTPSVAAASVSGDLVLDGVFFLDTAGGAKTLLAGAGQTSLQEIEGADTGYEGTGASRETASGASTTMSWTINSAPIDEWGIFAFAVNAATGGGGPTPNAGFKSLMGVGR